MNNAAYSKAMEHLRNTTDGLELGYKTKLHVAKNSIMTVLKMEQLKSIIH